MKKRTPRKRLPALNLFEKAVIRKAWGTDETASQIHAHIGADAEVLAQKAGSMFFLIVAAARRQKIPLSHPFIQGVKAGTDQLIECVRDGDFSDARRKVIAEGLNATLQLRDIVDEENIFHASVLFRATNSMGGTTDEDFNRLFQP